MRILIAIQDLANIYPILQFTAQFNSRAAESITILVNIESGLNCNQNQINSILEEARIRVSLPVFQALIRVGNPVKNILHEVEIGHYDLVVVNDQPNHRISGLFRVAKVVRITQRIHCPVIVVKGKTHPIQNILMCDSGSPESPFLSSFTARVIDVLPGKQDVTILHVMSQISAGPGVRGEQLRANAGELIETHTPEGDLLERDLHSFDKSGLDPVPKVRHGLVVDEILAEAQSGDYDLIIIGAHRQKWHQFLLEDLSRQIIERADRPVLIVK